MYIQHEQYNAMYGADVMDCNVFERLSFQAERILDRYTTGYDGVAKLRTAFPAEETAVKNIRYCTARLIHILHQIEQVETAASYADSETGQRRNITHVQSGNESITYADPGKISALASAAADRSVRESLIADTIREYLSGVTDSNGVNLLYMGAYPRRYLC